MPTWTPPRDRRPPGCGRPLRGLARVLALVLAGSACSAGGAGISLSVDDDVGPWAPSDTASEAGDRELGPPTDAGPSRADARSRSDALPAAADADRIEIPDAEAGPALTVATLNVSTLNLADPVYLRHISNQPYEDFVGARLRALDADLVALQGLLPAVVCATANEADPSRTCFEANLRPTQAERLLGPDYQVVCDAGRGSTCLGVHRRVGLPPTSVRQTSTLPLPPCSVGANACDEAHCDEDTAVTRLALDWAGGPLSVAFFLLNGAGRGPDGAYTGQTCRALQVDQLFDPAAAPGREPLLLGDLAFDPDTLLAGDAGARLAARLRPAGPYADLAPRDAVGRRTATDTSTGAAQDTVIVTGLRGTCEVVGEPTFDTGFDLARLPGGADDLGRLTHRAVSCRLRAEN